MDDCLTQATKNLIDRGYIGKNQADAFIEDLNKFTGEIRKRYEDTLGVANKELIDAYVDSMVDETAIKRSLEMAISDRTTALRTLGATDEATDKIATVITATMDRGLEMGNVRGRIDSSYKTSIDTYATSVQAIQGEIMGNFFDNTKITTADGKSLDLFAYTSSKEGMKTFEDVLIKGSTEGLTGEDKAIMDATMGAIDKVDKLLKSAFGKSASLDNVFRDSVYKDSINELKRTFLKNKHEGRGLLERVFKGTDLRTGNNFDEWKEYLKDYIKENMLDQKYLNKDFVYEQMTNAKFKNKIDKLAKKGEFDIDDFHAKKLDMLLEDIAERLDSEIRVVNSSNPKGDVRLPKTSSGLYNYLGYEGYLRPDAINIYKDLDVNVLKNYNTSLNKVVRKYGALKTFGEEPATVIAKAFDSAKKMTKNSAGIVDFQKGYYDKFVEIAEWEAGRNLAPASTVKVMANALSNLAYGFNLVGVGMAQFNDMTTTSLKASNITRKINYKPVTYYVDNLGHGLIKKFKKDGMLKDTKDLVVANRITHLYSDTVLGNKEINVFNSELKDFSSYRKGIMETAKKKGTTEALVQATSPLTFMDVHQDASNLTAYKIAEDSIKDMQNWKDLSNYKRSIMAGAGFEEQSYNAVAKVLSNMFDSIERADVTIGKMDLDSLEKIYKEFSLTDKATISEIARNRAKFRNKYINFDSTKGKYGYLSDKGSDALLTHINNHYNSQVGTYREQNWLSILENKGLVTVKSSVGETRVKANEAFKNLVKLETVTGTEVRATIDRKGFEGLFYNEKFARDFLTEMGYDKNDLSFSLSRLRERMEKDLNIAYVEMLKEDVDNAVYRATNGGAKEKQKISEFRNKQFTDNENYRKKTLNKFRNDLQMRLETAKLAMTDDISSQNPDVFEKIKNTGSDIEYAQMKFFTYMKNALNRNVNNVLDLWRFTGADLKERGSAEKMFIAKYVTTASVIALATNAFTSVTQDLLDGNLDDTEKVDKWAKGLADKGKNFDGKEQMIKAIYYTGGGFFVGHGLNATKLTSFVADSLTASSKVLEKTYEFASGETSFKQFLIGNKWEEGNGVIQIAGKPLTSLLFGKRVKDMGEGVAHIGQFIKEDLIE